MAYRILKKVKDGGSIINSLYQFVPTTIDGVSYFLEFDTKAEVDEYVEEQLNNGVPKTSLEVVAPMKYTVSASIEDEDCGCQVPSTNPSPTPVSVTYTVSAGPVAPIAPGGTVTFVIDADCTKFVSLSIDDVVKVKDVDYTVVSGSTIITLATSVVDALSTGSHTAKFMYTDGSATMSFSIADETTPSEPSEDTEDPEDNSEEGTTPDPTESEGGTSEEGTNPPSTDTEGEESETDGTTPEPSETPEVTG